MAMVTGTGYQHIPITTQRYEDHSIVRFHLANSLLKYAQAYQPAYPAEVPNNGVPGPLPVPGPDGDAQSTPSIQQDTGEDRPRGRKRTRNQVSCNFISPG